MLPLLKLLCDGYEHTLREITERLAMEFNLTEQDKMELLPSGRQYKYKNRIGWAKTYLNKAGLIKSVGEQNS